MRRQVVGWVLASLAVSVSGCQSWSQVAQGIPSGSRVPPPGTGTYQVPSSYYNNGAAAKSGAVSSNAQPAGGTNTAAAANTTTASNTTTARTASQPLPSTGSSAGAPTTATTAQWQTPPIDQLRSDVNNTASAVFNNVATRANQVVQAGTARAAAAVEQYTDEAVGAMIPPGAPPANLSATPANFAAPATSASSRPTSAATSRSLNDKPSGAQAPAEEPQLDWQAPE